MATTAASAQQPTVFPHSHVGFDSITSQIERKLLKRGFQFNVMCVGMCWAIPPIIGTSANFLRDRPNWSWKIDSDQHYFRIPPD